MKTKVKVTHADERRSLYDPLTILNYIPGNWYPHAVLHVKRKDALLGNHYHTGDEVFFTPNGTLYVTLINIFTRDSQTHVLNEGGALIIPSYTAHLVTADAGSVFMTWGSEPFGDGWTKTCDDDIVNELKQIHNNNE